MFPGDARFSCPSASLRLLRLRADARRVLAWCVAGALAAHWGLSRVAKFSPGQRTARPLTTHFVKRQPRLTKPLELKKRPQPRQRALKRRVMLLRPRASRGSSSSSIQPTGLVHDLVRPITRLERSVALERIHREPLAFAGDIQGAPQPKSALNMSLEMLDIGSLDTGQYHAMVVVEPADKKEVRGFFRVAFAYSTTMAEAALDAKHHDYMARLGHAYVRVVEAMNRYTNIRTVFSDRFAYDSEELAKVPWIYAPFGAITFKISQSEAHSLGRYMLGGGFLFLDDLGHEKGRAGDVSLRGAFKDALATQGYRFGVDWVFQLLPNSHHLYHCYFDFDQGPPRSWSTQGGYWTSGGKFDAPPEPTLDGVEIGYRLLGIMSNQAFANAWGDWNQRPGYMGLDPTRSLQFGVNTIVFALTQEGSITRRVMNTVE